MDNSVQKMSIVELTSRAYSTGCLLEYQGVQRHGCLKKKKEEEIRKLRIEKIGNLVLKK